MVLKPLGAFRTKRDSYTTYVLVSWNLNTCKYTYLSLVSPKSNLPLKFFFQNLVSTSLHTEVVKKRKKKFSKNYVSGWFLREVAHFIVAQFCDRYIRVKRHQNHTTMKEELPIPKKGSPLPRQTKEDWVAWQLGTYLHSLASNEISIHRPLDRC